MFNSIPYLQKSIFKIKNPVNITKKNVLVYLNNILNNKFIHTYKLNFQETLQL